MLRTLAVVLILVPGLVAAFANRFAALLLYLWWALFRPQDWMWLDITSLRVSLLLGLLVVVPSFLTGVLPNLSHPLSVGGVVFLVAAGLAQLDAVDPATSLSWLEFLVRLILICLLAISLVSNQKRFKLTLAVIAGSFGFHAAKTGLMALVGGVSRLSYGLGGAYADNNGYAVAIGMIIPLLVAVAQNSHLRWVKAAFYVAVPLSLLTVISTFSRGGFLTVVAAGLAFALLQRRRFAALVLAGALALPVGIFMTLQEGYLDRLQTIRTYDDANDLRPARRDGAEESALGRLHFWRVAIDMARARPLGVGLFGFEPAYDQYDTLHGQFGRRRSVHSSHLQALTEAGVLGAAAYIGLFAAALRAAFRIRRRGRQQNLSQDDQVLFGTCGNALIVSMTAFLVGGSFVSMALNDLTWYTFALVASLDRISAHACELTEPQRVKFAKAATTTLLPAATWHPVQRRVQ